MNEALQIKMDDSWFTTTTGEDKEAIDKTNNVNFQKVILKSAILGYNNNEPSSITSNNEECSITSNDIFDSDMHGFQKNTLGDSEEFKKMDNNDLIIKLIEKVEQSNQQIKIDLNESEKRITEDRRESEKRISEERRLSEERIEKKFTETMAAVGTLNTKIDTKVDGINNTIDTKITSLETKIDGSNKWIMGLCLTTIIGIATMIFAAIAIYPKK